ncbi:uncharacterized protein FFB20_04431 [Fusarium fujikuroi]|nr:uncharacterized protein FFB20_04431 [Fusarium fujikuroi]SCO01731.1 uncharacterized protein FFE2_09837 [Fusarium fujikuroi]SCO37928.1 uncharacterized protein FFNC_05940 [Fusarium fujikuroi]SCV34008.1 uncharacterized protein FFFS_04120 [Fusarium fujikuroi]
MAYNILVYRLS